MKARIVFATGVFDLLHIEHVRFLAAAKNLGKEENYLVVGIDSDKRVLETKGTNRPMIREAERLEIVRAIKYVDEAFIIPENYTGVEDWKKLLRETKADIYAVSENSPHLENKRILCQETGVEFKVVYGDNPMVSTSKIIEKIKSM